MDATAELHPHESAEIEAAITKDLELEDQEDRLSNLPDDILSLILEMLRLHDAARTSVLSERWVHLFSQRSSITMDIGAFHTKDDGSEFTLHDLAKSNARLIQATKSMLSHTSRRISNLCISFLLSEESIDVVSCVDNIVANGEIGTLLFLMYPEIIDEDCTPDHKVTYGRRFMGFLGAAPRAFGGLTYLHIGCVGLNLDEMTSVLNACNNLEHLYLDKCNYGFESVMEIEHPQLTTLTFDYCIFETAGLRWLPRLTHLTCEDWTATVNQKYPISFGYVPQLSTLILKTPASIHHKTIRLSEFLSDKVMITVLDLDFVSLRIWIEPEAPKFVGPVLQNLRFLSLRSIHEECDLDWIMFFLEAAPLLQKIHVQVWDHPSCGHESQEFIEECKQLFQKKSDYLSWQAPDDLKHHCLKELIILGYQVHQDKFNRFVRCIVEAAVKLEQVILLNSGSCRFCSFLSSTRFPETEEDRDHTMEQISEWASSPLEIKIRNTY